tara:strand:- start:544 stop:4329 length:3786 start_codon:yes stop_codon:yes gene_type:complete
MAKQVWKLGKFDKGINSHSDPKDIKEGEWVELDDVNISKVGVAKAIGQANIDTSVHQTSADKIIPGNGFYRFTSDNSYMPASPATSYHILTNTLDGGGGTFSEAIFSIESLVWVFPSSSEIVNGYLKFQLFHGTTAITDQFTVVHSDGTPNFYTSVNTTPNSAVEVNIYGGTTESFGSSNFDDLYSIDSSAPTNSAMIGQILNNPFYTSDTSSTNPSYITSSDYSNLNVGLGDFGWSSIPDWFSNGFFYSSNSSHLKSDAFWDRSWAGGQYHEIAASYYNDSNLPFSATFDASNYPNGSLSIDTHDMMGFYKWSGYKNEYGNMDYTNTNSGFTVPVETTQSYYDTDYDMSIEYFKMKNAFQSQLIYEINNYSGGSASDRFYAQYLENTAGDENINDYDSSSSTPPSASGDGGDDWHVSEELDDMIRLFPRTSGAVSGAINCKMTYYNTSGASISSNGGEAGSTGISSAVHLLDDKDTYGFIPSEGDSYEENNLETFNVTSLGPHGGAMVLRGNTSLQIGDPDTTQETWKFILKGNPASGVMLSLYFEGTGSAIDDKEIVNFPINYATNEAALIALKSDIDALTGYTSGSVTADSDSSGEIYPGYYLEIKASTGAQNHQFNLRAEWRDFNGDFVSTIGVDDEQFAFISQSSVNINTGSNVLNPLIFKLFSTFSNTWITRFANPITSISDNNANKYLNWYAINTVDSSLVSDPLFYDEGNVLRIAETNFSLKQQLESTYFDDNVVDNIYNDFSGYMWANPTQWLGYKDISNHFGSAFNYSTDTKGFFIGLQAKIWNYTKSLNQNNVNTGLVVASTNNLRDSNHAITGNDSLMKVHFHQGSSGGIDWTGSIKIYAVACYDDGSESLPSHYFSSSSPSGVGYFDDDENNKTLKLRVLFKPANSLGDKCFDDARINGIRLYYTHSEENNSTFWNLGKFDFNRGFVKASVVDTTDSTDGLESKYQWATASEASIGDSNTTAADNNNITLWDGSTYDIEYIQMPKTKSYEDINGFSPLNNTLHVDFKSACIAGRRAFVGNIRVWNGYSYEYYNDRMVVSPVNALDSFPYPANILDLDISDGDEIIALTSYGDKVLQFKKRICYILNISTGIAAEFFIEERHKWKGIQNKNHYCITDNGIFWANDRGAWLYNGEELKDLFIREDNDSSQQIINRDEWASFISEATVIGYDAFTRDIIIVKKNKYTTTGDSDCFIYSLIVNSWTKGIKRFYPGKNNSITNFQNTGSLGKLCYLSEENNAGGSPDTSGSIH